jgi:copper chaperone CopZ
MNSTTTPTEPLTLSIDGMSCGHCVQTVTKALAGLPSVIVRSVAVGSAEIEAATPHAANDAIAALHGAGYPARVANRAPASPNPARATGCCGGPKGCCG